MSSANFLKSILAGFADSLQPLREAVASPDAFAQFLKQFGWTLATADLSHVSGSLAELSSLGTNPSAQSVEQLAADLVSASKVIRRISQSGAPAAFASTFPRELLDYLVYFALAQKSPPVFALLHFVGVLTERRVPADANTGRAEYVKRQVHWDRLGPLADDPLATIKLTYGWGTEFDADVFLSSLGMLVRGFGGRSGLYPADKRLVDQYYSRDSVGVASTQNLILSPPHLEGAATAGAASANTKLAFLAIPIPSRTDVAAAPDGFAIMPVITGQASDSFAISDNVSLKLSGDFLGRPIRAEVHPDRAVVRGSAGDSHVDALARLDAKTPADAPWIPIGDASSCRLEVSAMHASLGMSGELNSDVDLRVEVGIDAAALVIDFREGDSFLQQTVSSQPTRSPLSFILKWSSKSGFSLGGQPKLQLNLPIQQSLAGVASLQKIDLTLGAGSGDSIELDLTLAGSASIGPLTATIDDVGLRIGLVYLDDTVPPGNLGNLDLQFGFKPPNGIGLVIDAPVVTGGGFLRFDPQMAEYSGILQLEVAETIAAKAIGLLTTRLPDGSKGYSLLILISAEGFAPIQLGFGFTLTGIGGLLGVNRTVMADVLRGGIKTGTLGSILFPQDPIRNAPQIVSDLRAVFPPAQDRYLFGPMALISWGTPTILTLEFALILEIPEPIRLIILGRLQALLPDESNALIQVRMDAIGVIDFNKGDVSLDATLYDSRILEFVLTGDMALRANWGDQPNFVLAIGGLHPRFAAPAGFPRLERLALTLSDGDTLRLRYETYLALTANTVQFGARLDLHVAGGGFTVDGYVGYDALFQFAPFAFVVDIGAGVALRYHGQLLMGIFLEGTLSGPTPWHIHGTATFKVWIFKISVSIDRQLGSDEPAPLPAPVDVLALVVAAVQDARNWSGELPRGEHPLVSVRERKEAASVRYVHPLAELSVRQRVAPLNVTITKFGNVPLGSAQRFTLTAVHADNPTGALPLASTVVQDAFALAQFQEMSEDEKLSRPSFETHDAGLRFGTDEVAYQYEPLLDADLEYETQLIVPGQEQEPGEGQPAAPYRMPAVVLDAVVATGAAGQATLRRRGNARYRARELAT